MQVLHSMMNRKKITVIFLLLAMLVPFGYGTAQRTKSSLKSGEQRNAEKGLNDNRYYFYFINSSISNFGTDEQKAKFRESIQRDMIAQILYMKFTFHESFTEIRKAQGLLIELYRSVLSSDISMTMKLLNGFAPEVAHGRDSGARHYLRLGYRDVALARQYMVMADNFRESLFSMRLYKYVEAIKLAKHGKRYAFLAVLESRKLRENPDAIEKEIRQLYNEMHETNDEKKMQEYRIRLKTTQDRYRLAKAELGYLSFDELHGLIMKISDEKKESYSLVHHDNYYRTLNGESFFDAVWNDPRLEEIKEYSEYRQKY